VTIVRMLYFAAVRELVGIVEENLELPASVRSVADLPGYLERAHPVLEGRLRGVRIAVNETFATADEQLKDGDVIALIPPVAGG
jgi:molybdopterin converting factor subunit 1